MRTSTRILAQAYILLHVSLSALGQSSDLESSLDAAGIEALFPSELGYANASRPFNLRFDLSPTVVVYPTNATQVSTIIQLGAAQNLQIVARSGGHNYVANGLGGPLAVSNTDGTGALVVDLSKLNGIDIDEVSGLATLGPGNRLGRVAEALHEKGRAMAHGSCPYVGLGGHVSGGGFGYMSRMWGLVLDQLVSAEIVLANGTIATASNVTNAELFWGIRGAASSFGILTSLTFQTHAEPEQGHLWRHDWHSISTSTASAALIHWQSLFRTLSLPSEFLAQMQMFKGDTEGTVSLTLVGTWFLPLDTLNATLAPFLEGVDVQPDSSSVTGETYFDIVENLAGSLDVSNPQGGGTDTFYMKSLVVLEDEPIVDVAWQKYVEYVGNEGFHANLSWFIQMEQYGGQNSAIGAVGEDDTAYAWRDALFTFQIYGSSVGNAPPYPESGFEVITGMYDAIVENSPSDWKHGAYLNYIDDKLENWQEEYYGSHYGRLQALKRQVDGENVFRFWTSIEV